MDLEEIDSTLHRVMMRLHPEWDEAAYQAWLTEWDDDDDSRYG